MKPIPVWKQNIGFPAVGIGILIIVASLYGRIERLPLLTGFPNEFVGFLALGGIFIAVGLFLTWPRD